MKILIIGFLAFSIWSTLATYTYVCKIKGLCDAKIVQQIGPVSDKNFIADKTISKPLGREQAAIPNNLIIYFAFDKSGIESDAGTDKYFDESNNFLAQNSNAKISITGYTDAVGSDVYNQALGYRRAQSLQHYFESKGMPANKIIIKSMGKKGPIDNNNTSIGRATNRRTAITIKN